MVKDLLSIISSNGDRGSIVPISRLDELKQDMLELKNGDFHTVWIDRFSANLTEDTNPFIPTDLSFEPRSMITIARPSPKVILQFNYRGNKIKCTVPPAYLNPDSHNERIMNYLQSYLSPLGYSVVMRFTFPQKILAVHSGLTKYGRNNISYNDEFGSYMGIMTYVSDMPCDEDTWFPLRRMDDCDNCQTCVEACPTGAFSEDRKLVNSDKCITFFNELTGEFPDWLDNDVHNSVVGCTRCQDCCPVNIKLNKDNIEDGIEFTESETKEILSNTSYSEPLSTKLKDVGIYGYMSEVLPRNLSVLLQKEF